MKTLEEIRAGGATLVMHMNGGYWWGRQARCNAEPRIQVVEAGPKGQSSKAKAFKPYRDFVVDGDDTRYPSLELAVFALAKRDEQAARDKEFDDAAPAASPEEPLGFGHTLAAQL